MSEHAGRPLNMFAALLLCVSAVPLGAFVDELDDSLLETRRTEDIWLIKFYAPWCSMCKQLDPLWHRIGSELKSAGSHVNVGKCDAVANAGELAFVVLSLLCLHGNAPTARQAWRKSSKFAAIPPSSWKKDVKYPHIGPLTEDAIVKFVHRVSGPLIRPLTSVKLFQHALSHHDVMFVYIGASSPLKGVFSGVAQEMIVSTFFFSAGRDVLPKAVSLPALPAVVVFKDGGYFSYNEMSDGSLKAWIKRERFSNYAKVDSYTLYAMGDSGDRQQRRQRPHTRAHADTIGVCAGKLVLLALLDDDGASRQNLRYKSLVKKVSQDYKDVYSRDVHFGFMEGDDYINGLVMGYYLPPASPETERNLLDFLDRVLDGTIQAHGGNTIPQRVRRFIYETKVTLLALFVEAPLLGCFLLGFPLGLLGSACYACRTAPSDRRGRNDDDRGRTGYSRRQIPDKKSD
ncbi:protein disulfide-isomerase TMX3-like isoform X7 [Syngnathoides biaculeatus]|uniref:protein disulfide-isomerase TMX3-like isoform X7 n=1 Tax=Syngnathoides biaculeatus TaxID=300417 RepID=UPI002ADE3ADD|nr:protein disulfide-isomerase TMX3-like isoform X7 [Syngnathoides biaculeatus]